MKKMFENLFTKICLRCLWHEYSSTPEEETEVNRSSHLQFFYGNGIDDLEAFFQKGRHQHSRVKPNRVKIDSHNIFVFYYGSRRIVRNSQYHRIFTTNN